MVVKGWRRGQGGERRRYEEVGWQYEEVGWGYEENNRTRTPALGKVQSVTPEMKHFCWETAWAHSIG